MIKTEKPSCDLHGHMDGMVGRHMRFEFTDPAVGRSEAIEGIFRGSDGNMVALQGYAQIDDINMPRLELNGTERIHYVSLPKDAFPIAFGNEKFPDRR